MAFHDRLKQAREKKYTQAEIANLLGIAKSTYSGYETGRSEPSVSNIANLMMLLEVSGDFLWQDELEKQFKNEYPEYHFSRPGAEAQSTDEEELLTTYRALNVSGKKAALASIRGIACDPEYSKQDTQNMAI